MGAVAVNRDAILDPREHEGCDDGFQVVYQDGIMPSFDSKNLHLCCTYLLNANIRFYYRRVIGIKRRYMYKANLP